MAWTNTQKAIYARACKAVGLGDDQRHMMLSVFEHAHCPVAGKVTSRSTKLNNGDFEHAMSDVEAFAESVGIDRITLPGTRHKPPHHYTPHYWRRKAADENARMRRLASQLHTELVAMGKLHRASLGEMVRTQTHQRTDALQDMERKEIAGLIEALKAIAKRERVRVDHILTPGRKRKARTPHAGTRS